MKSEQLYWSNTSGWVKNDSGNLDGKSVHLVLYFGEGESLAEGAYFHELKSLYPNAEILGCSGISLIRNNELRQDKIVATALSFEKTHCKCASIDQNSERSMADSARLLAQSLDGLELSAIFLFLDGMSLNAGSFIKELQKSFSKEVPILGGISIDDAELKSAMTGANEPARSGTISAAALYGEELDLHFASLDGCLPFGPPREVTRSEGTTIFELDGEPASSLMRRYLPGEDLSDPAVSVRYPFRIYDGTQQFNRSVVHIDEEAGHITCAGDVPEGSRVQIMRGNLNGMVEAAERAAQQCNFPEVSDLSNYVGFIISCAGRALAHGDRIEEELDAVSEVLGTSAPTIGFYSYGEICPLEGYGLSELNNHTLTLFYLSER